jgi:aldose 1-epimerase
MKRNLIPCLGALALALGLAGCATQTMSPITQAPYGHLPDGQPVDLFILRNANGAQASIINYGGIVTALRVPDRGGRFVDVVLGYDKLEDYLKDSPYFGCLVGRYGNRICKGKFTLNGTEYTLATNNFPNALHGGLKGFDKRLWKARSFVSEAGPALELTYRSVDGEEGYPGNLDVTAVYTLTKDNALRLDYTATTDKDTVINLTQHSYFNLAGGGDVLGHVVMIDSDKFTPVDATLIPTGELKPVTGTPFDFRKPTAIGERIGQSDEQLKFGGGYDHNWVINRFSALPKTTPSLQARVVSPKTGIELEVLSTEPALQFYSGNFLNGSNVGKSGTVYNFRNGFCMEPQHYPDSPNQPSFPTVVLKPGETYKNTIIYRFSVAK